MSQPDDPIPVFALDETYGWEDLEDAMSGCVEWQSANRGKIIPLMLFAPMTEPENPDGWEPMKVMPDGLLAISIERTWDALLFKALKRAHRVVGPVPDARHCREVTIDFEAPLAEIYRQMDTAKVRAFTMVKPGRDDPSFFFLRGRAAVQALSDGLQQATRRKA